MRQTHFWICCSIGQTNTRPPGTNIGWCRQHPEHTNMH